VVRHAVTSHRQISGNAVTSAFTAIHPVLNRNQRRYHVKNEKNGRGNVCEKRMCFQVIQPKNVFGFGATLLDAGVLLRVRQCVMHSIYYTTPDLNHEAESFLSGLMLVRSIFQIKYSFA
jgi:hypothetical protein